MDKENQRIEQLPKPLQKIAKERHARRLAQREATRRWQDELLLAIMECDAAALAAALDEHGDKALRAMLQRKTLGQQSLFLLHGQAYPRAGSLREVLGGEFEFEAEQIRETIWSWLDMIGARDGDSMLNLVLRLNGADEERKAACAVELLGRGIDWERENADGSLPSMIDGPAFKHAFFRALPKWREEQRRQKEQERQHQCAQDAVKAANRTRMAEEAAEQKRQDEWTALIARADEAKRNADARDAYHVQLQNALAKLARREHRAASGQVSGGLMSAFNRADRWLRHIGCNS